MPTRSRSPLAEGLDECIRRVRAYEAAGVDAIFLAGASTRAEVEAVNAELNIPLLLGGAGGELSDKAWLGQNGVRVALQGHLPFQAAIKAVYDTLKALRDGTAPSDLAGRPEPEFMKRISRQADYDDWLDKYMR